MKSKFTQPSVTEVKLSLKEQTELKTKITECRKKEQDEIKKTNACRNSILEEFKKICIQTADKDGIKKEILFTVSNNLSTCVDDSGSVVDRVIKAMPNDILRLCLGNDKTVDFRTNYSRTFNNSRIEIHFRAI
jgi:hypothetical protein